MNSSDPKLTVPEIRRLLTQLTSEAAAPDLNQPPDQTVSSSSPSNGLSNGLRRLMEIYCVVKTGGVRVQTEAAQAHLNRELSQLKADLAAAETQNPSSPESASLRQEIEELRRSVNWRLTQLRSIDPDEEAAVAACLAEIERRVVG